MAAVSWSCNFWTHLVVLCLFHNATMLFGGRQHVIWKFLRSHVSVLMLYHTILVPGLLILPSPDP